MLMQINTGKDALVQGVEAVDAADLGIRYSSFRGLGRLDDQIEGIRVGMISWPGGYLAEASPERFGLNFDGLYNPAFKQPGLEEMLEFANDHDAGLSIVLPTLRYAGKPEEMRADVQRFMTDLLGGHYGPLPEQVILHIGSEYYHHFDAVFGDEGAAEYGEVASGMVAEINKALANPRLNPSGREIEVSVQAGRDLAEDEAIRDAFDDRTLASVDLVMHHRYPGTAEGVDFTLKQFQPTFDAWKDDVTEAGGERPELHLSEWNVASVTRAEALTKYIRDMRADGIRINRADVDLEGRSDADFEQYWQDLLATRDYGMAQPRLYLELFSEYQAEGMGAASLHAWDMVHAGRVTYVDDAGEPVQFVGAEMIDMLYESVEGLTVMNIATQNPKNADLWTYGYENDDRTVLFLSADDDARVRGVQLDIEGLEQGYAGVWVERLTAEVPADWQDRFDVPVSPGVDQSVEANTYALGHREAADFTVKNGVLTVSSTHPGEVLRVVIAHSPAEAAAIEDWAGQPHMEYQNGEIIAETLAPTPSEAGLPPHTIWVSAEGENFRSETPAEALAAKTSYWKMTNRAGTRVEETDDTLHAEAPAPWAQMPAPEDDSTTARETYPGDNAPAWDARDSRHDRADDSRADNGRDIAPAQDARADFDLPMIEAEPGAEDSHDADTDPTDDVDQEAAQRMAGFSEIAHALSMGGMAGLIAVAGHLF